MAIEKKSFSGGGINSDDDPKLLGENDYLNMENCRVSVSESGRTGRIENIKGTTLIFNTYPAGTNTEIGRAVDDARQRLIWFNHNSNGNHGIYLYDGILTYTVLLSSQVTGGLNFSKANRIHSCRVVGDLLYWTDGLNEPRRINIEAGIKSNHSGYNTTVVPYSSPIQRSVITVIRRQPGFPPSLLKVQDSDVVTNQIALIAVQFSYYFEYRDYEPSCLSDFSVLANYNLSTETFNRIDVKIPTAEIIVQDVLKIHLVVKYVDSDTCFIIKTWSKNTTADNAEITAHNLGTALTFKFYNDKVGTALDKAFFTKLYDSVPRICGTIEVGKNRLFMGNNLQGYNAPDQTSLTASIDAGTSGGGGVGNPQGQWYYFQFQAITNGGATSTTYPIYLLSVNQGVNSSQFGYYEFSDPVSHHVPPFPASIDFADLVYRGNTLQTVMNFYAPGGNNTIIQITDQHVSSTLTNVPADSTGGLIGISIFKSDAVYQLAVSFYDEAGRKCGIVTRDNAKIVIPDRIYNQVTFTTAVNWSLSNTNSAIEIPDFASYYSVDITKCLRTRFFQQIRSKTVQYASKDSSGEFTYAYSAFSSTLAGIAFDLSNFSSYGMGYTFTEGDIAKVYLPTGVFTLSIIGQDGSLVICQPKDIGTVNSSTKAIIEIYTPYKMSTTEPYFCVAQKFAVVNSGTASRQYSVVSGVIRGDVYVMTRNDGAAYLVEAMSPNDKLWRNWHTDAGRPNFVDTIGEQYLKHNIAFSNVLLPGTKTNGLSSFEALNVADTPIETGQIRKLQLTDKVQEDGSVMLAICEHGTNSIYLGEAQLVGNAGDAFIAQSNGVIGTINSLKGGFGTVNPESVYEYNGTVCWMDLNNQAFVVYNSNGLFPISSYKMNRFFGKFSKRYLEQGAAAIETLGGFSHISVCVNSFDKVSPEIYVTLPQTEVTGFSGQLPGYDTTPTYTTSIDNRYDVYDGKAKTLVFKMGPDRWVHSFTFTPNCMERVGGQMYGLKGGLYKMETGAYNQFFGTNSPARVCFVANTNPSTIRLMKTLSLEGNAAPSFTHVLAEYPNIQTTDLITSDYRNEEGVFYAGVLRDRLSPNAVGNKDIKQLTGDEIRCSTPKIMMEFDTTAQVYVNFINAGYIPVTGHKI